MTKTELVVSTLIGVVIFCCCSGGVYLMIKESRESVRKEGERKSIQFKIEESLSGKTISSISREDGNIRLHFTDGTSVVIRAVSHHSAGAHIEYVRD